MSISATEKCAERLRALADEAMRIRPIHRLRPHVFTEDKSELAKRMRDLATDLAVLGRASAPAVQLFTPSAITDRRGREIRVERRSFRA